MQKEPVTGVEARTEYYPPSKELPSLRIALEHARNQYVDLNNLRSTIETKATIVLSFSMAMIALTLTLQLLWIPIVFFGAAIFVSILIIEPKPVKLPNPPIEDVFKLAQHTEEKALDLLLISYLKVNQRLYVQSVWMGKHLRLLFFLMMIGLLSFGIQASGAEFTLFGMPI